LARVDTFDPFDVGEIWHGGGDRRSSMANFTPIGEFLALPDNCQWGATEHARSCQVPCAHVITTPERNLICHFMVRVGTISRVKVRVRVSRVKDKPNGVAISHRPTSPVFKFVDRECHILGRLQSQSLLFTAVHLRRTCIGAYTRQEAANRQPSTPIPSLI